MNKAQQKPPMECIGIVLPESVNIMLMISGPGKGWLIMGAVDPWSEVQPGFDVIGHATVQMCEQMLTHPDVNIQQAILIQELIKSGELPSDPRMKRHAN